MAVTELARLRLKPPTQINTPSLLSGLQKAKEAMESFSGCSFHLFHGIEDPAMIYLIGGWKSVRFHMEGWIPSQANQDLLGLLKDEVGVDWMFHVDIDRTERELPVGEKVLAIERYFLTQGQREEFQKVFAEVKHALEVEVGGKDRVLGGWRIDKEIEDGGGGREQEEWVLFTGWGSHEARRAFEQTKASKEYSRLWEYANGVDINHMVKMEL